jgi:hypothetical protein
VRLKRLIVCIAHARHDEGARRTERGLQCVDQPVRAALDRTYFRERRVNDEDAAGNDAEVAEIIDELVA